MTLSRIMLLAKVSTQRRRWQITVVFVAAFVCCGLYLAAQAYVGDPDTTGASHFRPQLIIGATRHDFGRVTAGTVLQHEFTVDNCGTTRIVLNRNVGGCCGGDSLDDYTILPPGRRSAIPVTVDTSGTNGPFRRVVRFTTSDPKRPKIEFAMTARVVNTHNQTARRSANGN